jgi:sugar lactone lactonase YvrE
LLVDSFNTNSVLRYNEATGAFVDQLVPKNTGGLYSSASMDFGPDHNLYVSNGLFSQNNKSNDVLRFDGTSGTFLGDFADSGKLTDPRAVIFGSDGNLYVADGDGTGQVLRYNGQTGAFLDVFVHPGAGGLNHPSSMLFGPDGDLYVLSTATSEIQRYQGPSGNTPGAYIDTFVTAGSGGEHQPLSMAFGPDGNLYVANSFANDPISGGIQRYQGPSGNTPGAFINTFIAPGTGGLIKPLNLIFGPDGDLFVGSADATGGSLAKPRTSAVLRYQGATGEFLGTFVTPDSGGLRYPTQLLFTESDPVTLAYTPRAKLTAASAAAPVRQFVSAKQVQPLLVEAHVSGQAAGVGTSGVGNLPNQVTIVRSNTGDLTAGSTLDPDLLTVQMHQIGYAVGPDDDASGVRQGSLTPGARYLASTAEIASLSTGAASPTIASANIDLVFAFLFDPATRKQLVGHSIW